MSVLDPVVLAVIVTTGAIALLKILEFVCIKFGRMAGEEDEHDQKECKLESVSTETTSEQEADKEKKPLGALGVVVDRIHFVDTVPISEHAHGLAAHEPVHVWSDVKPEESGSDQAKHEPEDTTSHDGLERGVAAEEQDDGNEQNCSGAVNELEDVGNAIPDVEPNKKDGEKTDLKLALE